ncbi:pep-cterm sorting domain-containing protein [Anaeramoeba ignava]|uniref:Pep-cterm sorting domain-containing protein n=1 Tax=Anaeramoeba ignava TaxID=1746090 RepID=A0A9Q0L6S0_ANAIG|nr:pep-cterm sorting domain-containing protein [Anaeramoeba ignava]
METYLNLEKLSNDLKNLFQNQNQNEKEKEKNHLNFILSNDDIEINEFELFQSIIKWGKHKLNINQEKELEKEEKEKIQDQISNIIDKIRFINFSKEELEDTLKQDLIPNQISQKLIQFQKLQNEKENSFIFKSKFKSKIISEKYHSKKLKEWINDDKFFSKMKKGYSAQKDGFDCKKWHDICDNKGKTLIIIKTKDNFIFGGFTSIGFTTNKSKWRKEDRNNEKGYIFDSNAFIFTLRNDKNNRKPQKFPIRESHQKYSIFYNYSSCGPDFGFSGFDFSLDSHLQPFRSNFGYSYNLPNGINYGTKEAKCYLAGSYNSWVVDELETYFI